MWRLRFGTRADWRLRLCGLGWLAAYYEEADLVRQSALLMIGISQAQAFIDGNKRTAFIILFLFVLRSGYRFKPASSEELEDLIVRVADLRPPQDELVAWFKARLIRA